MVRNPAGGHQQGDRDVHGSSGRSGQDSVNKQSNVIHLSVVRPQPCICAVPGFISTSTPMISYMPIIGAAAGGFREI